MTRTGYLVSLTVSSRKAQRKWNEFVKYSEQLFSSLPNAARTALERMLSPGSAKGSEVGIQLLEDAGLLVTEDGSKRPIKFLQKFARTRSGDPPAPGPSPGAVRLKITISSHDKHMSISCDGDVGQDDDRSPLPFDEEQLVAVLKALDPDRKKDFDESQKNSLSALGLWDSDNRNLRQNCQELVGEALYNALFKGQASEALATALERRSRTSPILLELSYHHHEVLLARYPWELLPKGASKQTPLLGGIMQLFRHVKFEMPRSKIEPLPRCRLFYVRPRPIGLDFPEVDNEHEIILNTLRCDKSGKFIFSDNAIQTFDELQRALESAKGEAGVNHLIHFDGHGRFGHMCQCGSISYPHEKSCSKCHESLEGLDPIGLLAFGKSGSAPELKRADEVSNLLSDSNVCLVFLSACETAKVFGDSVFGGVATRLIGVGVPAVVAMQSSIGFRHTTGFAEAFYRNLVRNETIPQAMSRGRQTVGYAEPGFVPTLYLRVDDASSKLFTPNQES